MARKADKIAERNKAIKERFNFLYNRKRKRIDDVIIQLADEFYLAELTVQRILKNEADAS